MSDIDNAAALSDTIEQLIGKPLHPPRELPDTRTVLDKQPGAVTFATDRASFSGCAVLLFTADAIEGFKPGSKQEQQAERIVERCREEAEANDGYDPGAHRLFNAYFEEYGNLTCLYTHVDDDGITAVVTTFLDEDDLDELQEVQKMVNAEMRKRREARAAQRAEELAKAAADKRYLEIGEKVVKLNLHQKYADAVKELAELKAKLQGGA